MRILLIICLLFSISIDSLYSQNKTLKGRVVTEELEIYPFTHIVINDTVKVGKTDLNGSFQIEIPVSVKKVLFMNVGMETASIELSDNCQEIEVVLMPSYTYDFMPLKKVDRRRKKRFKGLAELHKKAFEKGIFKTANACYIQDFIPYYKKKPK
jgi:hypothetical protein